MLLVRGQRSFEGDSISRSSFGVRKGGINAQIQVVRKNTRRQARAGSPYKEPTSNTKLCGSATNSLASGRI